MEKKESGEKKENLKEEISEVFEVENGKKRIIETHAEIEKEEEKPSKKEIKKENKVLKTLIIVLVGFVLTFLIVYGMMYYTTHFEVEGVKFEVVNVGQLTLYQTSLPGMIDVDDKFVLGNYHSGEKADYNFYLRTDPRQLKKIDFQEGISQIKKENVLDLTDSFNCNGNGIIAIANVAKLYKAIGTNLIKDENASCEESGRYSWIQVKESEDTNVERIGESCYNININDCEILEGTERFMLETLIEVNKELKK